MVGPLVGSFELVGSFDIGGPFKLVGSFVNLKRWPVSFVSIDLGWLS